MARPLFAGPSWTGRAGSRGTVTAPLTTACGETSLTGAVSGTSVAGASVRAAMTSAGRGASIGGASVVATDGGTLPGSAA